MQWCIAARLLHTVARTNSYECQARLVTDGNVAPLPPVSLVNFTTQRYQGIKNQTQPVLSILQRTDISHLPNDDSHSGIGLRREP
ncbi:hypothetical protein BJ170DRAFT_629507 [Xylariales sp. AK1849]|nr:hypothetical protein BJ170DRAFT_629507 [Xylariales sp. AK1849]